MHGDVVFASLFISYNLYAGDRITNLADPRCDDTIRDLKEMYMDIVCRQRQVNGLDAEMVEWAETITKKDE